MSENVEQRRQREQREEQVLELRRAGLTFDAIAEKVGYKGRDAAHKAFLRALRRAAPIKNREDFLDQELDRIDRLHAAFWAKALRGDKDAASMIVKISERRETLLRSFTPREEFDAPKPAPQPEQPAPASKLEKLRAVPRPA